MVYASTAISSAGVSSSASPAFTACTLAIRCFTASRSSTGAGSTPVLSTKTVGQKTLAEKPCGLVSCLVLQRAAAASAHAQMKWLRTRPSLTSSARSGCRRTSRLTVSFRGLATTAFFWPVCGRGASIMATGSALPVSQCLHTSACREAPDAPLPLSTSSITPGAKHLANCSACSPTISTLGLMVIVGRSRYDAVAIHPTPPGSTGREAM